MSEAAEKKTIEIKQEGSIEEKIFYSRICLKNRFEKNPENTVRVSRPSRYGNPFPLTEYTREESLRLYEEWLKKQLVEDPSFLSPIYNKNLACFCKLEEKCHADILLKFIRKLLEKTPSELLKEIKEQ